eukprot:12060220-Heterocapsa_arctica.AAC.1
MIKASQPIWAGMEYSHLRCLRVRMKEGTFLKTPKKYIQKMQQELGMENCAAMPTPMVIDTTIDETEELDYEQAKVYRTVNGIMQYMSKFRPDMHYAIKELGRRCSNPTV